MEMAEKNRVMECWAGSHLYGFATAASDEDYRGVFIPNKDYVLGMKHVEQVEQKEPDRVLYAIGKFFQLALNNNPNIIELLYVPKERMIYMDSVWELVRKNAHLFLSKKCRHSFGGYAHAQLKRIHTHKKWIDDPQENPPNKEDYINVMTLELFEDAQFIQTGWDEIKLVDMRYRSWEDGLAVDAGCEGSADLQYFRKDEYEAALKKHKQYLDWKKNRNPDRAKLEASYGFDGKHGSHLIRLLKMAVEILKDGEIVVDRSLAGDAQLYLDIRNGEYSYDELISMSDELEAEMDELYESTSLQNSPDVNAINDLLIEVYEDWYK